MSKDEHSYFGPARLDKLFWDDEDVGVITQGTGFFRPHFKEYHPYGQARERAYRATNPIITTASVEFGVDEGFLRACLLHLAELAVAYHESVEVFHFAKSDSSKADRRVVLSGYSKAVQKLKKLLVAIKTTATSPKRYKKRWDGIKGRIRNP